MKVSGKTTKLMVLAPTFGKMVASTSANGPTTICKVMVFTYTRTGLDMMVNTLTIKKRAMDCTIGRMAESTKAGGTRVNNMDWVFTSTVLRKHRSMDSGKTEDELVGLMISR